MDIVTLIAIGAYLIAGLGAIAMQQECSLDNHSRAASRDMVGILILWPFLLFVIGFYKVVTFIVDLWRYGLQRDG